MKERPPAGVFLLTVGDEILDGRIQNTNASWFGEQLRLAGIPVSESRSVPDNTAAIAKALRDSASHPLVLVTGGLGPTNDDRTLAGAALAFRAPLGETKASLKHISTRYRARGIPLTAIRLKMALVPKGSRLMTNTVGTAPGIRLNARGAEFFFLPGPPSECQPMFARHVLPFAKKTLRGRRLLHHAFWRTFGRSEGDIYQLVSEIVQELECKFPASVAFGIHISFPYIDITLEVRESAKGGKNIRGKHPSPRKIEAACQRIDSALGSLCFSRKRESLADAVALLLKEQRRSVSSAESCTGGLLGKMLTDAPGSSRYYAGGVVSYANSAKEILLDINKKLLMRSGAVSEAAVRAMAESIRRKLGTTFALAISGIAGPGGGTEVKPVGTIYVAISSKDRTRTMRQVIFHGQGTRDQNRVIAAHLALDALRTELLGSHDPGIPVN